MPLRQNPQAEGVSEMLDLIARLEAATGPNAELDTLIHEAVHGPLGKLERPQRYTASLDAAMTLLVAHCCLELTRSITFACDAIVYGQDMHASAEGATLPLALCIAGLKARQP